MSRQGAIMSKAQRGFTLIELMITLVILLAIVWGVSQMIKAGFDIKSALSQRAKVTHRFDVALQAINRDLSGAFIISSKDTSRDSNQNRTIFRISKGDSDTIAFTYVGHTAIRENAKESNISFVVYQVKDSKVEPGRKNLYRGETPRVPKEFREQDIPLKLIAEDIAEVHFDAWRGDEFSKDRWDSTNGDTKDLIPPMVRVTVLAWEDAPDDRLGKDVKPTVQYATVVALPFAQDLKTVKQGNSSFSLLK